MKNLFKLLSHLPWWFMYGFAALVWRLMYYVVRYRRKVVRGNLQRSFPEWTETQLVDVEKKFYRHLCSLFVETVKWMYLPQAEVDKRFTSENTEELNSCLRNHRRAFVLLSHYGNWEYIPAYSKHLEPGTYLIQLYKQLTNPRFDELMRTARERFGSHSVESRQALRTLVGLNNSPDPVCVGFLSDQSPLPESRNIQVQFLGQQTPFIDTAERLASKMHYAVYYGELLPQKRGCYKLRVSCITPDASLEQPGFVTKTYANLLEKTIQRQPEYYLWSHNRWKYAIPS